ncbi:hypothetical protein D9M69_473500 [compost metagenome]
MLDWFANAATSIGIAKDVSQSLVTLRDAELVRSKVFELTNSLMDLQQQLMLAQIEQMELIKKVTRLENELLEVSKKDDERHRYQLHQFERGAFAYALKPEFKAGVPEHYLCSNCFEGGDRVTMQNSAGVGWKGLRCPRCDKAIVLERVPVQPKRAHRPTIW